MAIRIMMVIYMNVLDKVRDELNRRKGTWPQICDDVGLGYSYVSKIAQGHIKDPGHNRLMKLYNYFNENNAA